MDPSTQSQAKSPEVLPHQCAEFPGGGMDSSMRVDTPVTTFEAFHGPSVRASHMQRVCKIAEPQKNQEIKFGNFTHAFKTAIF